MWRLYIFLVVVGIALAGYGGREYMLGKDSSAEPEAITIEQLETGVPDNPYRRLGRHVAVLDNVVYQEVKRNGSSSVDYSYYPAVSDLEWQVALAKHGIGPDQKFDVGPIVRSLPIKVVVKTRRWKTVDELKAELQRDENLFRQELIGTVTNRIDSIGSKEAELLKQASPSFDPNTTVIIEEGRKPTGVGVAIALIAGGVALAVSPVVIWLVRHAMQRPHPADDWADEGPRPRSRN